ncbi:MAG: hypothetical protein [Arizlama microvirus]|nr:MAG: hypothetical protein [Arizlama microvirus]
MVRAPKQGYKGDEESSPFLLTGAKNYEAKAHERQEARQEIRQGKTKREGNQQPDLRDARRNQAVTNGMRSTHSRMEARPRRAS